MLTMYTKYTYAKALTKLLLKILEQNFLAFESSICSLAVNRYPFRKLDALAILMLA